MPTTKPPSRKGMTPCLSWVVLEKAGAAAEAAARRAEAVGREESALAAPAPSTTPLFGRC